MKNILKYTIPAILIGLFIAGTVWATSTFNSSQVGSSPSAGEVLQTNGTVSTWVATSTLGIIGGNSATTTITSNILTNGPNFTFATSTTGSGTLGITGSGSTITFNLNTSALQPAGSYVTNSYASSTFPSFGYASSTFVNYAYGTSTYATILNYPTYTYASSTYQPAGAYLTGVTADSPLSGAGTSASHLIFTNPGYILNSYASSTFPSFTYGTSTYVNYPYASSTFSTYAYGTSTYPILVANNSFTGTNTFTGTSTQATTTITQLSVSSLTSGNCLQAGSGGLLTTISIPCVTSSGSGSGVPSTTPFTNGYVPYATSTLALTNSSIYNQASTGNIGIGTTTPGSQLTIANTTFGYTTNELYNKFGGNAVDSIYDADTSDSFNGIQGYTFIGSKSNNPLVLGYNNAGECGLYDDNTLDTLFDCYPPANGDEMTYTNSLPQASGTVFTDKYLMNYGANTGLQAGDIYARSTSTTPFPEVISGFWNQGNGPEATNTSWRIDIAPSGQEAIGDLSATTTLLHTGPIIQLGASSTATTELAVYGAAAPSLTNSLFSVNQNGNVGIASSTPNYQLSIGNNFSIDSSGDMIQNGNYQQNLSGSATNELQLRSDGSGHGQIDCYTGSVFCQIQVDAGNLLLNSRATGNTTDIGTTTGTSALNISSNGNGGILNLTSVTGVNLFTIANTGALTESATSTLATTTITALTVSGVPTLSGVANCNSTQYLQITSGLFGCGTPSGGGGSGGGPFSTSTPYYIYNNTGTALGINTTTPPANLTVEGISGSTTPVFEVASSSNASEFQVTSAGNVVFTGQHLGQNGGPSNPTYSFSNSTNTGLDWSGIFLNAYVSGVNAGSFSTNGIETPVYGSAGAPSISLGSNSTAGLYGVNSTNDLAIASNGVQRMFFDPQGYTGINSSTPTATLVVQGYSGSTTPDFIISSSSNTSLLSVSSIGNLAYATATANSLAGFDAGNILQSETLGTGLSITGKTLNASNAFTGSGTNGQVAYWTSATALASASDLLNNGTVVGINATSSTVAFNIQGTSGFTGSLLNLASSTGVSLLQAGNILANGLQFGVNASTTQSGLNVVAQIVGNASNSTFSILQVASSTGTSVFQVNADASTLLGSPNHPSCMELYDSVNTTTLEYLYTASNIVTATTTKPSFCH